eukprot:NODE_37_length_35953_cov_1.028037.p17 type:complete len:109 gc:universal NODE_37_length_35953_cov_1.028037:9267-9593(+)
MTIIILLTFQLEKAGIITKVMPTNVGPEWVWVKGYYEMAKFQLQAMLRQDIEIDLQIYNNELAKNEYRGLPELTNEDGSYCYDSCSTQAWSGATLLEFFHKKYKLENK